MFRPFDALDNPAIDRVRLAIELTARPRVDGLAGGAGVRQRRRAGRSGVDRAILRAARDSSAQCHRADDDHGSDASAKHAIVRRVFL